MDPISNTSFYDALPRVAAFATLSDPASYAPLPDDWVIGVSDIVGSTWAIAQGKCKTVNMVGAAVISAQINACGGGSFPYVFGGDGAGFAVAPELAVASAAALVAVQRWASAEFNLTLRVAQVPVADIRAAGMQVAVARYQASAGIDYAMFAGGGLPWAERQMKAGSFALPPAPPGTIPDLTGLSCRWSNIRARNGVILSIVVQLVARAPGFSQLCQDVLGITQHLELGGHHPLAAAGSDARGACVARGHPASQAQAAVVIPDPVELVFLTRENPHRRL